MFRRSPPTTTIGKPNTTVAVQVQNTTVNNTTTTTTLTFGKVSFMKRRWFIIFIYTFVFIFIIAGVADVFLFMKSIVRRVSLSSQNNNDNNNDMNDITTMSNKNNIPNGNSNIKNIPTSRDTNHRCAINFFGLPRAYESLVLPSIIKNIIIPNPNCDYYIHYYYMTQELQGRSGSGGNIDPTAILLLRNAVHTVYRKNNNLSEDDTSTSSSIQQLPIVEFIFDKEEDFWIKYTNLIERIRTTMINGKYLYFPWKAKTYQYPVTTDNIIKMWHSIQSSYQLMEDTATSKNIDYTTVAMFRSDVVYVTPIHIHDAAVPKVSSSSSSSQQDNNNNNAVPLPPVTIPNFGKHPVSDRCIYGPREAVKIWATQRFTTLERHVDYIYHNDPGWGMHSEKFVNYTLLPMIQNITNIRQHPTLCFFRARADESIWVSDCSSTKRTVAAPSILKELLGNGQKTIVNVVQDAIGRQCAGTKPIKLTQTVQSLDCSTPSS